MSERKINLLSPRLKNVFIDVGKQREVSLYDYYRRHPDKAAEAIQREITFDGKYWNVSDMGCRFNYIDYINLTESGETRLVRYSNGLVLEVK